ncbi:hypothetical protein ACTQ4M_02505, partial [Lactobacillus amylovorus]
VKPSNFHFKNKKHRNSLKIMNCCVFISGLKIEFFPRHFLYANCILSTSMSPRPTWMALLATSSKLALIKLWPNSKTIGKLAPLTTLTLSG